MRFINGGSAYAAAFSALMLVSGCGGGGSTPAPPPPPPPPVNGLPTLTTSAIATDEDVTTSAQLAATDPDNNPVTFAVATNPQHGALTLTAAGILTYAPTANYSGADSFTVTVSDNAGGQATGTVNVTVRPVNDLPVLTSTQFSVNEDAVLNVQLSGTDIEGDTFTFVYVPSVAHGGITGTAAGGLTYTPNANYSGSESLRYRLVETSGLSSAEQTVAITITPQNDAPQAQDDVLRVSAVAGANVALPVLTNDTDIDGDPLTPIVVTQPRGGTVAVNPATQLLTFYPDNDYLGPIEFTYRVSDGKVVQSQAATVRAVIGDFENLIFLSDYTTPGVTELHLFDGLEVRRVSDALSPGSDITTYAVSRDLTTVAYVVDSNDAARVYVKPLDGSAVAALRYTSPLKSPPPDRGVSLSINADGSYMVVNDTWTGVAKTLFVVNTATGATKQVAGSMPGLVDVRFAIFHPFEPQLLMVQGQTAGTVPRNSADLAMSAFLGDAADASTLTQIGRTYASGEFGSGEGFYFGDDPRYIYHGEYLHIGANYVINLLVYDRVAHTETAVVRNAAPPDRGVNGVGWLSPNMHRMCIGYYEASTTVVDGPSRFYALNITNPASALAASPVLSRITSQCAFASDNRTMIYRVYTPGYVSQEAYAVDSLTPGAVFPLAPAAEAGSEQSAWMLAPAAMRVAIAFFTNDGVPGSSNQVGRYYSIPIDGSGNAFLFSDNYPLPELSSGFFDSNSDGSFVMYARPQTGKSALEIMSTRALNLSIPVSRLGEAIGVRNSRWLRRTQF